MSGDIGDIWKIKTASQRWACPCTTNFCPKTVLSGMPVIRVGGHDCSTLNILDKIAHLTNYTSEKGFNDPDVLEVGNHGQTVEEYRSQFSFWAALKAPLLIGTDLSNSSRSTLDILSNKDVIAINQDPLRRSIRRVKKTDFGSRIGYQIWAGPLHNGDTVLLVLNSGEESQIIPVDFSDLELLLSKNYILHDLWTKTSTVAINGTKKLVATGATWMVRIETQPHY